MNVEGYLVINTRMESGRVMAVVQFDTMEEADAFIHSAANEMKDFKNGLTRREDGTVDCEYVVVYDEHEETTTLETDKGDITCAWDIFPVIDIADTPEKTEYLKYCM